MAKGLLCEVPRHSVMQPCVPLWRLVATPVYSCQQLVSVVVVPLLNHYLLLHLLILAKVAGGVHLPLFLILVAVSQLLS